MALAGPYVSPLGHKLPGEQHFPSLAINFGSDLSSGAWGQIRFVAGAPWEGESERHVGAGCLVRSWQWCGYIFVGRRHFPPSNLIWHLKDWVTIV